MTTHQMRVGAVRSAGARSAWDRQPPHRDVETGCLAEAGRYADLGRPPLRALTTWAGEARLPRKRIAPVDGTVELGERGCNGGIRVSGRPGAPRRLETVPASVTDGHAEAETTLPAGADDDRSRNGLRETKLGMRVGKRGSPRAIDLRTGAKSTAPGSRGVRHERKATGSGRPACLHHRTASARPDTPRLS